MLDELKQIQVACQAMIDQRDPFTDHAYLLHPTADLVVQVGKLARIVEQILTPDPNPPDPRC